MSYQVQANDQAPAGGFSSSLRHVDDSKELTKTAAAVALVFGEKSPTLVPGGKWVVTEIGGKDEGKKDPRSDSTVQIPIPLVSVRLAEQEGEEQAVAAAPLRSRSDPVKTDQKIAVPERRAHSNPTELPSDDILTDQHVAEFLKQFRSNDEIKRVLVRFAIDRTLNFLRSFWKQSGRPLKALLKIFLKI